VIRHALREAKIRRPRPDVREEVRPALVVHDRLFGEEERDELVLDEARAEALGRVATDAVVEERLVVLDVDDVAPVGATDGTVDVEELRRLARPRVEATGEDRDLDPARVELADRGDVDVVRRARVVEERPVEIEREKLEARARLRDRT
jgi:hypothetical protein